MWAIKQNSTKVQNWQPAEIIPGHMPGLPTKLLPMGFASTSYTGWACTIKLTFHILPAVLFIAFSNLLQSLADCVTAKHFFHIQNTICLIYKHYTQCLPNSVFHETNATSHFFRRVPSYAVVVGSNGRQPASITFSRAFGLSVLYFSLMFRNTYINKSQCLAGIIYFAGTWDLIS